VSKPASYLHLKPGTALPEVVAPIPSRVVVVVEAAVSIDWQSLVSDWIVQSGCLYMMAWGVNCSSWDDSVDVANLEAFNFNEIPDDKFVMTTWHSDEPLEEAFWFSKNNAFHPTVEISRTVILHVAESSRESELLDAYAQA